MGFKVCFGIYFWLVWQISGHSALNFLLNRPHLNAKFGLPDIKFAHIRFSINAWRQFGKCVGAGLFCTEKQAFFAKFCIFEGRKEFPNKFLAPRIKHYICPYKIANPSVWKFAHPKTIILAKITAFNTQTMKLPSISYLINAFVKSAIRFPLSILAAFAGAVAISTTIENRTPDRQFLQIIVACWLSLALCTGIQAFAESRHWDAAKRWGLLLAGLVLVGLFAWSLDPETIHFEYRDAPRIFGLGLVFHLFVAIAPYIMQGQVGDFWEYNKQLFGNFLVGAAYTLLIWAGLSVAILAIDQLFEVNINWRIYSHLFVWLAAIFQTTFFLYNFPSDYQFEPTEFENTVVFRNLCKYILIPIIVLYFVILYAFSIKILFQWNLPHGWVSKLVIGFSVAGIFTYLLNYLLPKFDQSALIPAFRKWFFPILLPMVGLLFIGVGRRIMDHGVTEPRFMGAHIAIWLLLLCLYFIFSKKDDIRIIPITLIFFALIAVFGPFSANNVAQRSQYSALEAIFEKNGMVADGQIKPAPKALSETDVAEVSAKLEYLNRFSDLSRITSKMNLPPDTTTYPNGRNYQLPALILENLKISTGGVNGFETRRVYCNGSGNSSDKTLDTRGLRKFELLNLYGSDRQNIVNGFFIDQADGKLKRLEGEKIIDEFDATEFFKKAAAATSGGQNPYYVMPENENFFELKGQKMTIFIYLQNAEFTIEQTGNYQWSSLNGYAFWNQPN